MNYVCDIILKSDIFKEWVILVFCIVQEVLVNVLKYSQVDIIIFNFGQYYQVIWLDIIDNGVGFDSENVEWGIGMFSMLDRVSVFDVELMIQVCFQ